MQFNGQLMALIYKLLAIWLVTFLMRSFDGFLKVVKACPAVPLYLDWDRWDN
jgi:hypothetical protein